MFTKDRALLHVPERFQNITQKVLVSGRSNLLTFLLKLFEVETKSVSNVYRLDHSKEIKEIKFLWLRSSDKRYSVFLFFVR